MDIPNSNSTYFSFKMVGNVRILRAASELRKVSTDSTANLKIRKRE